MAIDDVAEGFATVGSSRLVHTSSKTGVTGSDLEKAKEILGLESQAGAAA